MKDTPEIIAARAAHAAAEALKKDLKRQLNEAEKAESDSYAAIRAAMLARDELLPSCWAVTSSRWSQKEKRTKMVILRKTPAGTLVVRPVGTGEDSAQKYKPDFSGALRRIGKYDGFDRLDSVPAEFLPVSK